MLETQHGGFAYSLRALCSSPRLFGSNCRENGIKTTLKIMGWRSNIFKLRQGFRNQPGAQGFWRRAASGRRCWVRQGCQRLGQRKSVGALARERSAERRPALRRGAAGRSAGAARGHIKIAQEICFQLLGARTARRPRHPEGHARHEA